MIKTKFLFIFEVAIKDCLVLVGSCESKISNWGET